MYSPEDYLVMLSDDVRVTAYLRAIAAVVRPGDVVLELGTGPGFFAVAACRAGAERVYAVEPDDIVSVGPAVAAANGCADRITFIRKASQRVTLPVRAHVLIEDMRGALPILNTRFAALVDADSRLLVPGARRIPRTDTLWAAPCRAPEIRRRTHFPRDEPFERIAVDPLSALMRSVWGKSRVPAADLLAAPRQCARLDYMQPGTLPLCGDAEWEFDGPTAVDGWCVWFDAELADGIGFSNAPGQPEAVYAQAYFPLKQPMSLASGSRMALRICAVPSGDEHVWVWDTTHIAASGVACAERQSTLAGAIGDGEALRRSAPDAVASPSGAHAVYATLLRLTDGARTNASIAREIQSVHPAAFASEREALAFVTSRLFAIGGDETIQ